MQPCQHRRAGIGGADQYRQMLAAAVARAKGDQPCILGVGERNARIGDPRQAGHRGAAAQHDFAGDDGEIGAAAGEGGLGRGQRQHQHGRQQRGELGERDRGQLAAFGDFGFRTEARRFGPERGRRIGEVADDRRRQQRRQADRYRAGERVAPGQSQRHRAAPGQHDAQLPVGHGAQPRQIVVVDELGGERQHRPLAPVEQDRLAAPQRDDCRVEHPPAGRRPGDSSDRQLRGRPGGQPRGK